MKKNYPAVRVIIDCTEFEIEQPTNPQAQQDTWSTYKNTNTAKGTKCWGSVYNTMFVFVSVIALVGITPNGIVSYISPLYGGATSDRSLLNMTGPGTLRELMEDGDQIMSDRGFALDPKHSHLTLIFPPFLEGKSQLSPEKVINTRIIARHRIHVERCMGRIKNYKLLNGVIPMKSIYLLDFWFYICTFLTIFDEPLVKIVWYLLK
jgi:DDE superfamily endonuclease